MRPKYHFASPQHFLRRVVRRQFRRARVRHPIVRHIVRVELREYLQPRHQLVLNIAVELVIPEQNRFVQQFERIELLARAVVPRGAFDNLLDNVCDLLLDLHRDPVGLVRLEVLQDALAFVLELRLTLRLDNRLLDQQPHRLLRQIVNINDGLLAVFCRRAALLLRVSPGLRASPRPRPALVLRMPAPGAVLTLRPLRTLVRLQLLLLVHLVFYFLP